MSEHEIELLESMGFDLNADATINMSQEELIALMKHVLDDYRVPLVTEEN